MSMVSALDVKQHRCYAASEVSSYIQYLPHVLVNKGSILTKTGGDIFMNQMLVRFRALIDGTRTKF